MEAPDGHPPSGAFSRPPPFLRRHGEQSCRHSILFRVQWAHFPVMVAVSGGTMGRFKHPGRQRPDGKRHDMLDWLRKRFLHHMPAAATRQGRSPVIVTFTDERITVTGASGAVSEIAWGDIMSVTILTTDRGPLEADLIWLLSPRDRHKSVMVPMGAEGENEFLHAMQARLAGFDNVAVIEAMGSTSNASFPVWEASAGPRKGG